MVFIIIKLDRKHDIRKKTLCERQGKLLMKNQKKLGVVKPDQYMLRISFCHTCTKLNETGTSSTSIKNIWIFGKHSSKKVVSCALLAICERREEQVAFNSNADIPS
jgi:hypothetical protein